MSQANIPHDEICGLVGSLLSDLFSTEQKTVRDFKMAGASDGKQ